MRLAIMVIQGGFAERMNYIRDFRSPNVRRAPCNKLKVLAFIGVVLGSWIVVGFIGFVTWAMFNTIGKLL